MSSAQFFTYLLVMAGVTYLIRVLPFALITKKIENDRIRSFLYYIPYAVLTAMTIPAALTSTGHVVSAAAGLAAAVILAMRKKSLTFVAVAACAVVYVVELLCGILM